MRHTAARFGLPGLAVLVAVSLASRSPAPCTGDYCGTLVLVEIGSPGTLLPPVTDEAIDRDIFDQIFLKLADIGPDGNTLGDRGFEPLLAQRWRWEGKRTLVFSLDPRARWHDGRPVTAADVAFSFQAYRDTTLASPYQSGLRHITAVTARDSATVVFWFADRYPEMFYDAVYHMRILPRHLLDTIPRSRWRTVAFGRAPVGAGPYRFVRWTEGQSLELAADSGFFLGRPHIRRLIFRFASDFQAAVTMVTADEADAIPVLLSPTNIARARQAPQLALYPYPGSVYTYLAFNLRANGDSTRAHPVFGDGDVRRALILASDRPRMLQSVFQGAAKIPPAPIPQAWSWLWMPELVVPPWDTARAAVLLAGRGWKDANGDGVRERGDGRLTFHILVPTTSGSRRQYARLLQEQFRAAGAEVLIDEVEPTVMQERLRAGLFDAAIESWTTDPTPTSGVAQLWRSGGSSNFGRYANPAFDRALDAAAAAPDRQAALRHWRDAFAVLDRDAPAILLNAPDNVAAVHRRVADVRLRSDSWWALVRTWRIPPDQLIDRDRLER